MERGIISDARGAYPLDPSVWFLPLFHKVNERYVESFCLDASGLLVYLDPATGSASTLIPHAVRAYVVDQDAIKNLESRIDQELRNPLFSDNELTKLYSNGLAYSHDLYAAESDKEISSELLKDALAAFDGADVNLKAELQEELGHCGIHPFYQLKHPSAKYYDSLALDMRSAVVQSPGWITARSIVRRAKLA